MNCVRRLMIISMLAASITAPALAADANVSGEWSVAVETGAGSGNPHLLLKQNGNDLTGMYKSSTFGDAPLTGNIKGNDFTLTIKVDAQGQNLSIVYRGTVDGTTMKGTVSLGDLGEGTFTAKKV